MIDPATVLELIGSALGLIGRVRKLEGAERAFEELEKLTPIASAIQGGHLGPVNVAQLRGQIDRLVERIMRHEELRKGEAAADAALAKKFAQEDE